MKNDPKMLNLFFGQVALGKEEGTSTPVFSEIISIGGKNWQIGRKNISARGLGAT
jgi:hypothetical protein